MKKLIYILSVLIFISCDREEIINVNYQNCCSPWNLITCDTQDQIIKINDHWIQNESSSIRFQKDLSYFIIRTTDQKKILDAQLFNYPYDLHITRPNDTTVVFYSAKWSQYFDDTDLVHVNLKLSN